MLRSRIQATAPNGRLMSRRSGRASSAANATLVLAVERELATKRIDLHNPINRWEPLAQLSARPPRQRLEWWHAGQLR